MHIRVDRSNENEIFVRIKFVAAVSQRTFVPISCKTLTSKNTRWPGVQTPAALMSSRASDLRLAVVSQICSPLGSISIGSFQHPCMPLRIAFLQCLLPRYAEGWQNLPFLQESVWNVVLYSACTIGWQPWPGPDDRFWLHPNDFQSLPLSVYAFDTAWDKSASWTAWLPTASKNLHQSGK